MTRRAILSSALLLCFAFAPACAEDPTHSAPTATPAAAAPRDPRLPADEAGARDALDHSPRHGEYVNVPVPGGGAPLRTWVVYPERRDKAGVVLLIHEIFGLSDWIRAVADQFAREGFIAVAPDLLSGLGPGGGGTDSLPSRDAVVATIPKVTPELGTARLDAVRDWATALPAANGKIATVGFCWGGGRSFSYATTSPKLDAAVVYYGVSPDSASLARISAPVLGLYGGDDARVLATVAPAERVMKALGKRYETHVFDGAGHGFLRQQADREGANMKAAHEAWERTVSFLKEPLKSGK